MTIDRSDPAVGRCSAATPRTSTPHELAALAAGDDRIRPPGWRLSPGAVVTYLLGGDGRRRHADHAEVRRVRAGSSRSPSPR